MLQLLNNSKFGHQKELCHKSPDWSLLKMVNSWAPWSLHCVSSQPEYPGLHLTCEKLICRGWMTNTRPQGQCPAALCHWNASKGIVFALIQSWSQSKPQRKKIDFSLFFPNTAEQTPSKYQGSEFLKVFRNIFLLIRDPNLTSSCFWCFYWWKQNVLTLSVYRVRAAYAQAAGDRFFWRPI